MKFKTIYRLNVADMFLVGAWDKEPTQDEIIAVMKERFEDNVEFLNGERLTFRVEKVHFLVSEEVKAGDFVQVVKPFTLEGQFYEYNEKFAMRYCHMAAGIEMNVKKVGEGNAYF